MVGHPYRTVTNQAEFLTPFYRFHHFLAGMEPNDPDSMAAREKFVLFGLGVSCCLTKFDRFHWRPPSIFEQG